MPKPFFKIKKSIVDEMLRVDHAGEFGAQRIYLGQIKSIKVPETKSEIEKMLIQEQKHLDYFTEKLDEYRVRPTVLMPVWNVIGYMVGFISAKLGPKAAMIVTESVEDVIEQHYADQIDLLEKTELEQRFIFKPNSIDNSLITPQSLGADQIRKKLELISKLKQFRQEEIEHKDIAAQHDNHDISAKALFLIVSATIKNLCWLSIFLSKKF